MRAVRGTVFVPCCGRRCASAWCRSAWSSRWAARIAYGIKHSERKPFFLTVTAPGIVEDMPAWNATAPLRFAAFIRDIRRTFRMLELEYLRILEMQRRGLLHVHAAVVGWDFCDFERVRLIAIRHGFGPRFEVEPVRSADGLGRYAASAYLAKSHEDLGGSFRVVQASRGWARDRTEQDGWAELFNVVDPPLAIPAGMTVWDWAEGQEAAGRGALDFDARPAYSYVGHYLPRATVEPAPEVTVPRLVKSGGELLERPRAWSWALCPRCWAVEDRRERGSSLEVGRRHRCRACLGFWTA